jgi:hypothetical protein
MDVEVIYKNLHKTVKLIPENFIRHLEKGVHGIFLVQMHHWPFKKSILGDHHCFLYIILLEPFESARCGTADQELKMLWIFPTMLRHPLLKARGMYHVLFADLKGAL